MENLRRSVSHKVRDRHLHIRAGSLGQLKLVSHIRNEAEDPVVAGRDLIPIQRLNNIRADSDGIITMVLLGEVLKELRDAFAGG